MQARPEVDALATGLDPARDSREVVMKACQRGDLVAVQAGFQEELLDLLLETACRRGHLMIIQWLLEQGGDFRKHSSPLVRRAHATDQTKLLDWMQAAGFADCLHPNRIFGRACRYGKLKVAQWAVQNGAEIYHEDCLGFRSACIGEIIYRVDHTLVHCNQEDRAVVVEWLLTLSFPESVIQKMVNLTTSQELIHDLLTFHIRGKRTKSARMIQEPDCDQ